MLERWIQGQQGFSKGCGQGSRRWGRTFIQEGHSSLERFLQERDPFDLRFEKLALAVGWRMGSGGRSRQTVRGCCRHSEERWLWLGLGGGSGQRGLWADSADVLEEEILRSEAGMAMG